MSLKSSEKYLDYMVVISPWEIAVATRQLLKLILIQHTIAYLSLISMDIPEPDTVASHWFLRSHD